MTSNDVVSHAIQTAEPPSNLGTNRRFKVGLVCLHGAINIPSWRGNADSIEAALIRAGVDVARINIKRETRPLLYKSKHLLLRKILKQGYSRHREPAMLRHYGRLVAEEAAANNVDVILALTTMPIAHANSRIPIAFWNDAPFAGMLDWYPTFSSMDAAAVEHGHSMEREAHHRSALAIYSSQWAADIAVKVYRADPKRTRILDFGPNITVTWGRDDIAKRIKERLRAPYRLVWLGVEWFRKGGDTAVAVAQDLYDSGFPVELVIAGTSPPRSVRHLPFVKAVGFLGKKEVVTLLDSAAFLVLPSRADLSPIVFSEASALGVPIISRPVAGIPEIVRGGRNGMLFGEDVAPSKVAQYIRETLSDPAAYQKLGLNAYEEFETRLNWDVAASRLCEMLTSLVVPKRVAETSR